MQQHHQRQYTTRRTSRLHQGVNSRQALDGSLTKIGTDIQVKTCIDNEATICYTACDVDLLMIEPEPQTDLWQHVKEDLSWDTYYKNKTVKQEIERIKNHGSWYFNYLSNQASPFIHYVTTELEKRGLPLELALLPFRSCSFLGGNLSSFGLDCFL